MKKSNSNLPLVVIFGRTNVGKSTLFNRLTEKSRAIVSDIAGTTRDSNIGQVAWRHMDFSLVDTGGIIDPNLMLDRKAKSDDIDFLVQKKASSYLKKADVIIFLVDAKDGLLPQDRQMAGAIKKIVPDTGKVILAANKADGQKDRLKCSEFYQLSLGEVHNVSAATGSGTGDLLDAVAEKIDQLGIRTVSEAEKEDLSICLIGKPNVGKSSLLNAILGEDRIIVSAVPHTTREPQDTYFEYLDKTFRLVDTAGISRKGQQAAHSKKEKKYALEKFGIEKTLSSLKKSDIAVLVIDVSEPVSHQETKIIQEIIDRKKGLIIVANKWDLIEEKDQKRFTENIRRSLPFISWVPIIFVSAKTKSKVMKVLDLAIEIKEERMRTITDSEMARFLKRIVALHRPTKSKGYKHPRIYELRQTYFNPPEFTLRIGARDTISDSYLRFAENQLRKKYGFAGTPLHIRVEKGRRVHGQHDERLDIAEIEEEPEENDDEQAEE